MNFTGRKDKLYVNNHHYRYCIIKYRDVKGDARSGEFENLAKCEHDGYVSVEFEGISDNVPAFEAGLSFLSFI